MVPMLKSSDQWMIKKLDWICSDFFTLVIYVFQLQREKCYHSINNLVVVDWKGEIIYLHAGNGGSVHDRTLFCDSPMYFNEKKYFSTVPGHRQFLIGDPGFRGDGPVTFSHTKKQKECDTTGEVKKRDRVLCYHRIIVEHVFAQVKERWAVLQKPCNHIRMTGLFTAACLLYNYENNYSGSWLRGESYLASNDIDLLQVEDESDDNTQDDSDNEM